MVKIKLFLQIQSTNIVDPNEDNMIVVLITKRIEIVLSIQVCLISWINFYYEENGGKKGFSCKELVLCIPMWRNDCSANKKKNGDYFEHPSLSHFIDKP